MSHKLENSGHNLSDLIWKTEISKLKRIIKDPKFWDFVKYLKTDSDSKDNVSISNIQNNLREINTLKENRNTLKEDINKNINIELFKKHYSNLPENDSTRQRMLSIILLSWLLKAWEYNIESSDSLSNLKNDLYSWMKVNFTKDYNSWKKSIDESHNLYFELNHNIVEIKYLDKAIWTISFTNPADINLINTLLNTLKPNKNRAYPNG